MADRRTKHLEIPLNGKLITGEPATIGQNFRTLTNLRYTDTHPRGVQGMTKINTSALTTYLKVRNAFHFRKAQPSESHVLVQAYNTGLTAAQVLQNTTAIPSQGAFSGTSLLTDSSGFGLGRFSDAPDGQVIYCNGVDNCIWGGSEQRIGAVIQSTVALAAADSTPTLPKDLTEQMQNTKTDSANIMDVSGSYLTFIVGSTRPAQGVKITMASVNASVNTLSIKESTAGVWTAVNNVTDNTRTGGTTSFAQTGTITWDSTVATTKPKYLNGYYLYWYQFTVDACDGDISYITLDLPFQSMIDLWDGIYRDIVRFYKYTTSQQDLTINVYREDYDSTSAITYADLSSLAATTQYIECGFTEKQTGLYIAVVPGYENSHSAAVAAEGTITMSDVAVADETFVIDDQTFTWKAARNDTGEVTIGASAAEAGANIETAVTADLDTVTAVDNEDGTVTITAVTAGTSGNSIVFTENSSNMAVDGTGTLGATTLGVDACSASVDYWNGSAYTSVGTPSDGTTNNDNVSFTKSGVISWNNSSLASEQKLQYANSIPLYYYRIKFDEALDSSVRVDYIGGITASKSISHFKFSVFAQGRVMLCADMAGEKNKAVVSGKYTPQVYNGTDSVNVYFGDEGELTCGTELFSQFGSSLYSLVLMFKDFETWVMAGTDIEQWENNTFLLSSTIGCPAPLTLKTINLHAEPGTGINRALAIWQGANGIYMSDGRAPIPIHGDIKEYFDPTDSRCIRASKVGDSVGFIDPEKQEYHWLFASGAAVTTLNKEMVYDIARNRWFEIDRDSDLQFGILVNDTDGNSYNYGFLDTGYMERLEYGTDFDGTAITHTLQTGDIAPEGLAVETRLSDFRLITVAKTTTSEDITLTHYSDGNSSGTDHTLSPANSGYRLAQPGFDDKLDADPFHSIKLTMSTDNETIGFEPLAMILTHHAMGED